MKVGAKNYQKHLTASLITYASKILIRTLNRRIYAEKEDNIREEQLDLRIRKGTREENNRERKRELDSCFIDFEKVFERVNGEKLMTILKEKGIEDCKVRRK